MQNINKANPFTLDLRGKEDRRSFAPPPQFPVVDSEYNSVKNDRRFIPDRRIANIQVKDHYLYIRKK